MDRVIPIIEKASAAGTLGGRLTSELQTTTLVKEMGVLEEKKLKAREYEQKKKKTERIIDSGHIYDKGLKITVRSMTKLITHAQIAQ